MDSPKRVIRGGTSGRRFGSAERYTSSLGGYVCRDQSDVLDSVSNRSGSDSYRVRRRIDRRGNTGESMIEDNLPKGTQIAYIPTHAEGDINHPDVEFGFIVRQAQDGDYFCRYWNKRYPDELRTKSNWEKTPKGNLLLYASHPKTVIDGTIFKYNI